MERNLTILLSGFINIINDAMSNIAETDSNFENSAEENRRFYNMICRYTELLREEKHPAAQLASDTFSKKKVHN
jgi:hypothetical protein